MRMMKFIGMIVFVLCACKLQAQYMELYDFREVKKSPEIKTEGKKKDSRNKTCAIIKVLTYENDLDFESEGYDIVDVVQRKEGEIWLYVSSKVAKLSVSHSEYGKIINYKIPIQLARNRVYQVRLGIDKIKQKEPRIEQEWITMHVTPEDALVIIDEKLLRPKDGMIQQYLPLGKHAYKVMAPYCVEKSDTIEVISGGRKDLFVELESNFGYLSVASLPSENAKVYIDGEYAGLTRYRSDKMAPGKYKLKVSKEFYETHEQSFIINKSTFLPIRVDMMECYGFLSITGKALRGAKVYIDDEKVGKAPIIKKKLTCGTYHVRIVKKEKEIISQNIQLTQGNKITITPSGVSNRGYLNVETEENIEAELYLNGVKITKLPSKEITLSEGDYEMLILNNLYMPFSDSIHIRRGETLHLNIALDRKMAHVSLHAVNDETQIWIDKEYAGKGTWEGYLKAGLYAVESRRDGYISPVQFVKITDEDPISIDLCSPMARYGLLNVQCSEIGTNVYLNGKHYGNTPCIIKGLISGTYELCLIKEGFEPIIQDVEVVSMTMVNLNFEMQEGTQWTKIKKNKYKIQVSSTPYHNQQIMESDTEEPVTFKGVPIDVNPNIDSNESDSTDLIARTDLPDEPETAPAKEEGQEQQTGEQGESIEEEPADEEPRVEVPEEKPDDVVSPAPDIKPEEEPEPEPDVDENIDYQYYIIIGSRQTQALAETFIKPYLAKGEKPIILYSEKIKRYRIAIQGFETQSEAQKRLQYVKQHYVKDAWIMKPTDK